MGDREARISISDWPSAQTPIEQRAACPRVVTGSTVVPGCIVWMVFLKAPCEVKVAGSDGMHRFWMVNDTNAGRIGNDGTIGGEIGCWYPENGQFAWINSEGFVHHGGMFWGARDPRAIVHADGSVTITEPSFDSEAGLHDAGESAAAAHANDHDAP